MFSPKNFKGKVTRQNSHKVRIAKHFSLICTKKKLQVYLKCNEIHR